MDPESSQVSGQPAEPDAGRVLRWQDYLTLIGAAGLVVAADQSTKFLVRTRLEFGEPWAPIPSLSSVFRIVHWNNTGAAFGLFPSGGLIFTAVAFVVAVAILLYYPRVPAGQGPLRLALALQLGGAIGNLIDRLAQGTVTDFISIASFPVFNLADASISLGVAVLAGAIWIEERRERKEKARAGADRDGHAESMDKTAGRSG